MQIRYGKPIKVRSLLGCQNIPTTISNIGQGYSYATNINNSFYGGWGSDLYSNENSKKINIISGHKYFSFMSTDVTTAPDNQYDCCSFYTSNGALTADGYGNVLKSTSYNASIIVASDNITVLPMIWNYYQRWTIGDKINYMIVIDLTEVFGSGKEPSISDFYNKYNKYFSLIATGEEIVLNTKTGNIKGFITEGTTNLISSVDPFNDSGGYGCYNGSTETYGWGSNTDMYKEVGLFQGKQCVKVYMGTAGRNAWPMPSIKNINPYSTTVNTYCTLSFDYYPTSITSLYPYSYRDGVQINSYLNGRSMNGATITNIPLNQWSHIVIVYKRTTDEYVGAGVEYIKIGTVPHTSTTTDYWLFANVQSEYKDHATPYVNGTRPDNYPISSNIAEKMYGYNQLAPAWSSGSCNGVTISTVENGIQLSGTATGWFTYNKLLNKIIPAGHKVLVSATTTNPNEANLGFRLRTDNSGTIAASTTNFNQIITLSSSVNNYQIFADLGDNCDGISVLNDMIIDLTEWYGEGNEPSTIAEFKEKFNKDYYGYCPNKVMLTQVMINVLPEYGYNQLFSIGSSNECTRTYNSSKDEYTLTANSSTTHSYFGLTCYGANYNLDSIKGHKALCMAYVSDISISTTFSNISFEWALTSITDYNRVTTAGNYVYGLGTWKDNASLNFINANGGTGYVVGDSFSVNKVMIIDLTDLYGEGNEPSTIAEFKQTFPHKYYPYSKKTPLNKYIINAMASK